VDDVHSGVTGGGKGVFDIVQFFRPDDGFYFLHLVWFSL
jgi:hypothetical protein